MSGEGGRFPWRALPALLYGLGIFYGGVIDIGPLPKIPHIATDKLLHALAFAGLSVLALFAQTEGSTRRRQLLAASVSIAVGGLLELVQTALPYRSGEWLDLVADAAGAILGVALVAWLIRAWASRGARVSAGEM